MKKKENRFFALAPQKSKYRNETNERTANIEFLSALLILTTLLLLLLLQLQEARREWMRVRGKGIFINHGSPEKRKKMESEIKKRGTEKKREWKIKVICFGGVSTLL